MVTYRGERLNTLSITNRNYGGNGSTIAKNCGLTPKEGDFVYDSYFESFPQLKDFFEWGFRKAARDGYIEFNNVTKRKFFFNKDTNHFFMYHDIVTAPGFWQTHEDPRTVNRLYNAAKKEIQKTSQNYPIQGSSSDITKYAGVMFMREILSRDWWLKVKIVNFIHDEILIECPTEMAKEVEEVLIDCMKNAAKPFCRVLPLGADAAVGEHWIH